MRAFNSSDLRAAAKLVRDSNRDQLLKWSADWMG